MLLAEVLDAVYLALTQYRNETVLGVVYAPYLGELFHAIKGSGAFLNDKKLMVSDKQALQHAVVCTGFPYNKASNPNNNLANVNRILPKVRGFRRLGAAAYDLSLVAAGILDGFWESYLHLWDIAVGCLLIEEAGGLVKLQQDEHTYSLVCGNKVMVTLLDNELA